MKPTYKPIPGLSGYRACSNGHVWSCREKRNLSGKRGFTSVITSRWHMVKPNLSKKTGYLKLEIQGKSYLVHRLILSAFRGAMPSTVVSRHLNGIRTDNRPSNLVWGTQKENYSDSIRHGTNICGEKVVFSKLTETDVRSIRSRYASGGISQRKLAREYGVQLQCIQQVIHRRSWKHVTD